MKNKPRMKSWERLGSFLKNKEIDVTKYVLIISQDFYEKLVDESGPHDEGETLILQYDGLRIMWSNVVTDIVLVTKEVYNQKYNPSSFMKLI